MRYIRLGICGLVMAAVMVAGFDAGQLSLGGSTAFARRHKKHHKHHRKSGRKHHKRHRSGAPEL